MNGSTWTAYYESQGDRAPRDLLVSTLDAFGPGAREAIDLGCGTGIETVAILRRGWRVFAVDAEPAGIDRLLSRASPPERERLHAQVGSIEDVELPTRRPRVGRVQPVLRPAAAVRDDLAGRSGRAFDPAGGSRASCSASAIPGPPAAT